MKYLVTSSGVFGCENRSKNEQFTALFVTEKSFLGFLTKNRLKNEQKSTKKYFKIVKKCSKNNQKGRTGVHQKGEIASKMVKK